MSDFRILQHEIHNDVVDFADLVGRLSTFCTAVGGDVFVKEVQIDKTWVHLGGGVYGWSTSAGNHYFEMDNGTHQARYRLTSISDIHRIYIGAFVGGSNYLTNNSAWPQAQTSNKLSGSNETLASVLPNADFRKVWFFGDADCVFWVVQANDKVCFHQGFGRTIVIDSANKTDYAFIGRNGHGLSPPNSLDDPRRVGGIFQVDTQTSDHILNSIVLSTSTDVGVSVGGIYWSSGTVQINPGTNQMLYNNCYSTASNRHSPNRLLFKSDIFLKDPADGQWFHHGSHYPAMFHLEDVGLYTFGEKITVNTEEFLCFPCVFIEKPNVVGWGEKTWHAYRIV